jgi:Domain of unknown function (DUF1843)
MSFIPLYGVTIGEACVKGDLDEMRSLAKQAEDYLAEHGNVPAALEVLKAEIAKAEAASGGESS